jgi:hypothetical protein
MYTTLRMIHVRTRLHRYAPHQIQNALRRLVVLLSVAFLMAVAVPARAAALADEATPTPTQPDLQVPYRQMATTDDGALSLSLVGIDEDSRCPREVMCVWQGRAVVRVQAVLDGEDHGEVALTTIVVPNRSPGTTDATVGPYTLHLVGLTPYPSVNQKPGKDEYVAIVRITRS